MKLLITILLTGLSLSVIAQKNDYTRKSINDDGKTLTLSLHVRNDSTSVNYERAFNVSGMTKTQTDDLINSIIDSLGVNKYFKATGTTSVTAAGRMEDKNLVTAAVMDYIDAFYFGDTSKITRSISPAVVKYGYSRKKDEATYTGMAMSYQQMIDFVLRVKARNNTAAAEKLYKKVEVLDYLDQTASAKATAWWGTDYILLSKLNNKWTITHVLWQSPPPVK